MTAEIKLIAILALAAAVLGGLLWYGAHKYDAGLAAGKAEIQVLWDTDKASIQKVTDAAIAKATAERDTALTANEAIANDYQARLSAASADAESLAVRLRLATSHAANSSPLPKAGNQSSTVTASSPASDASLTSAIAATFQECTDNAAQLDALIGELTPQL